MGHNYVKKSICLSEIEICLGVFYFYLLNMVILPTTFLSHPTPAPAVGLLLLNPFETEIPE